MSWNLRDARDQLLEAIAWPSSGTGGPALASSAQRAQPAEGPPLVTEDDRLSTIASWLAGGFALVAALLGFFGIKDGQLDRILRNDGPTALFVFSLIGLAVVIGTVAPAITPGTRVRAALAVIAVALPPMLAVPVLPDLVPSWSEGRTVATLLVATTLVGSLIWFGSPWRHLRLAAAASGAIVAAACLYWIIDDGTGTGWIRSAAIELALIASVAIAAYVTWNRGLSLKLAAVALGVSLFATGTYGAMKLAVDSKSIKDRPFLSAVLATKDDQRVVAIQVKASGLRSDEHIATTVHAHAVGSDQMDPLFPCGPGCDFVYGSRTGPSESGAVDASYEVPIPQGPFTAVSIRAFVCGRQGDGTKPDSCQEIVGKKALADLDLPRSSSLPRVTVSWGTVDSAVAGAAVRVAAEDLAPFSITEVIVVAADEPSRRIARASLPANADGSIDDTVAVSLTRPTPSAMCVLAGPSIPSEPTCDAQHVTVVEVPVPPPPPQT